MGAVARTYRDASISRDVLANIRSFVKDPEFVVAREFAASPRMVSLFGFSEFSFARSYMSRLANRETCFLTLLDNVYTFMHQHLLGIVCTPVRNGVGVQARDRDFVCSCLDTVTARRLVDVDPDPAADPRSFDTARNHASVVTSGFIQRHLSYVRAFRSLTTRHLNADFDRSPDRCAFARVEAAIAQYDIARDALVRSTIRTHMLADQAGYDQAVRTISRRVGGDEEVASILLAHAEDPDHDRAVMIAYITAQARAFHAVDVAIDAVVASDYIHNSLLARIAVAARIN